MQYIKVYTYFTKVMSISVMVQKSPQKCILTRYYILHLVALVLGFSEEITIGLLRNSVCKNICTFPGSGIELFGRHNIFGEVGTR